MLKKAALLFIITLSVLAFSSGVYAEGENLLQNPSFEEEKGGAPIGWIMEAWDQNPGAVDFKIETADPQDGGKYVTITNNQKSDSRYLQAVNVKENTKYKLSCHIKAENVGNEGKGANLSIGSQLVTSKDIKGTNGKWEYVEMYVIIGKGIKTINVSIGVGGYGAVNTGKASFDTVKMEMVDKIPDGAIVTELNNQESGSSNNNKNSSNSNNNAQNNQNQGGLSNVVWIVLLIAVIVVGVAVYNTFKTGKAPSESSNANQDTNKDNPAKNNEDEVDEFKYDD